MRVLSRRRDREQEQFVTSVTGAFGRWPVGPELALAALVALPSAAIALTRGFDGLYGQDAYAYFDYSTSSVRQSILQLKPFEAFFWPPGYPLLVALMSLAVGARPLAGQLVSLALGALVPVLTALLVRQVWPAERGLAMLAGLLVAVCGQLWQSSIVVMADTTGLACATFSAWALARYSATWQLRWLLAATSALVYALLARWIYGLVAIPFAGYTVWAFARSRSGCPLAHSRVVWHWLTALALAAALLVPVLGQTLLGLLAHPSEPASFLGNLQVYTWSPLNALRRDFFTVDGHLSYNQPNGIYYALAPANPAFFGPLLAPWAVLGLWRAVRAWPRPGLVLIAGWAFIVYAFHAGAPWQNFRFTLAYLPPLSILLASGLSWSWQRCAGLMPVRWLVVLCAGLGLLAAVASGVRLVEGFIDRKDEDLALVRWTAAQIERGPQLLTFGPTLSFRHYTSLATYDLFDLNSAELSALVAQPAPSYALVDRVNINQQWLGRAPADNLLRLEADPGLVTLATHGSYTLFRVGRP